MTHPSRSVSLTPLLDEGSPEAAQPSATNDRLTSFTHGAVVLGYFRSDEGLATHPGELAVFVDGIEGAECADGCDAERAGEYAERDDGEREDGAQCLTPR